MKKKWLILVCAAVLCMAQTALANSWGLKGELLDLVSDTDRWNDYTTLGKQAETAAVMQSRYHHVLLLAQNGALQAYTKAVFQPDGSYAGRPTVTQNESSLSIRYHDGLWFTFRLQDGEYILHSAKAGELTVTSTQDPFRYLARDENGTEALIVRSYPLKDFNIELFPQTINEVRHLNFMRSWLDAETIFSYALDAEVSGAGKGTAPVYSAPFGESAWRAANGKAAVGLGGTLWKLGGFRNADGEEYWRICYDVSPRTQRIGFVRREALDGPDVQPWPETTNLLSAHAVVIQETFLTDDPDVSQYPQFVLPVGSQLVCLGRYNDDYAVVSAEVKNGRLTDGGQIVWGYVPLRDLQPEVTWGTEPDASLMEQLVGRWFFAAGGISVGDQLELRADCTFLVPGTAEVPPRNGSWYVMPYNPADNLYWNNPSHEIVFLFDDGSARVEGLTAEADSFSLTNWEGGGGYERAE